MRCLPSVYAIYEFPTTHMSTLPLRIESGLDRVLNSLQQFNSHSDLVKGRGGSVIASSPLHASQFQGESDWGKENAKGLLNQLRYHSFPDVNECDIQKKLDGIREKFIVFGEEEWANRLGGLERRLTRLDRDMYASISFLLALSNSPLSQATASLQSLDWWETKCGRTEDQIASSNITWSEIIAQDGPLQGEHWQPEPDYESSEDSDSDDLQRNQESTSFLAKYRSHAQATRSKPTFGGNAFNDLSVIDHMNLSLLTESYSPDASIPIQESLYWESPFLRLDDIPEHSPLLTLALLRFQSAQRHFHAAIRANVQLVSEADVIREILFMLRGQSTPMFALDDEMKFRGTLTFALEDISPGALSNATLPFVLRANILRRMRSLTSPILHPKAENGYIPSHIAVLSVILHFLDECNSLFSDMKACTLLGAQAELEPLFTKLDVLDKLSSEFASPTLIDTLYNMLSSESKNCVFELSLFSAVLKSSLSSIQSWMLFGQLDTFFFIQKSFDAFHLLNTPICLAQFGKTILITGQTMNELKMMEALRCGGDTAIKLDQSVSQSAGDDSIMNNLSMKLSKALVRDHDEKGGDCFEPFSLVLERNLAEWISSVQQISSDRLKPALHSMQFMLGVKNIIDVMLMRTDYMYHFCTEIFEKLESLEIHADPNLAGNIFQCHFNGDDSSTPNSSRTFQRLAFSFGFDQHSLYVTKSIPELFVTSSIEFNKPWPFSALCKTSKSLLDELFTFLMRFRYARYCLVKSFKMLRQKDRHVVVLIQKLKSFLHSMEYYFWDWVIIPESTKLIRLMECDDRSINDMIAEWDIHIKSIHSKCLLAPLAKPIMKHLIELMDMVADIPVAVAGFSADTEPAVRAMERSFNHHVQIFVHGIQGLSSYGASAMESLASILDDYCTVIQY